MRCFRTLGACAVLIVLAACQDRSTSPTAPDPAPAEAVQGSTLTGYILFNGTPLRIGYRERDGMALWQGDVVVGKIGEIARTEEELRARTPKPEGILFANGISAAQPQWPGARVPYVIYSSVQNAQAVRDGMAQIQAQTGVRFVPRTTETVYLEVVANDNCSGYYNFATRVMYMSPCHGKALAMHELGHSLGLYHEHQRCDRDSYINLYWGNIDADGVRDQYTRICSGTSYYGTAYDFSSIMHYGSHDWWTTPHFLTKSGASIAGFWGRNDISARDVQAIRKMYGLAGSAIIIDSNNGSNNTAQAKFETSANWASSTSSGAYGTGYSWASTQAVSDGAEFWFYLPAAATKTVDAWWVAGSNRATSAPFVASNAAGTRLGTAYANQQTAGGRWNQIGTWNFSAGWNRIELSRWTSSGDVVIADAVRIR